MTTTTLSPSIRERLLRLLDGAEQLHAEYTGLRSRADRLREEIHEIERRLGRFDLAELARRRSVREQYDEEVRERDALRAELERLQQLLSDANQRAAAAVEPVRRLVLHFAPSAGRVVTPNWRPDLDELRMMVIRA